MFHYLECLIVIFPHFYISRKLFNILSVTIKGLTMFLCCRHALDTLISLAKSFPSHFLPHQGKETDDSKSDSKKSSSGMTTGAISKNSKGSSSSNQSSEPTDFWELLVKLDSISVSRKGKGLPRTHSSAGGNSEEEQRVASLEASALGQLIQQLAHPVIRRSSLLTDRLLRLLALISLGLPETADSASTQNSNTTTQHSVENSQTLEHLLKLAIQVSGSDSKERNLVKFWAFLF